LTVLLYGQGENWLKKPFGVLFVIHNKSIFFSKLRKKLYARKMTIGKVFPINTH